MGNLAVTEKDHILEVIIDRPKVNAISPQLSRELGEIFRYYKNTQTLRCAILGAAGERIFSAGWDLAAAAHEGVDESDDYGVGGFAGLTEVFDLNKPVIAAINGIAIGGGVELMLACDVIVAAEHAKFSLPEMKVGVVADGGGVQRLPRRLPYFIANDMLLTGRELTAQEALQYGLVNYVVPIEALREKAWKIAETIAGGAPLSVQATKQLIRETEVMSVEQAFAATRRRIFSLHKQALESEDHQEGPRAFIEKRPPVWQGR